MAEQGRKDDAGKLDWTLLPIEPTEDVIRVLAFGAAKYARDNWRLVPDAKNRYTAAAIRHIVAHQKGEQNDPESGLPHLAHAACCLLFLGALATPGPKGKTCGDCINSKVLPDTAHPEVNYREKHVLCFVVNDVVEKTSTCPKWQHKIGMADPNG